MKKEYGISCSIPGSGGRKPVAEPKKIDENKFVRKETPRALAPAISPIMIPKIDHFCKYDKFRNLKVALRPDHDGGILNLVFMCVQLSLFSSLVCLKLKREGHYLDASKQYAYLIHRLTLRR